MIYMVYAGKDFFWRSSRTRECELGGYASKKDGLFLEYLHDNYNSNTKQNSWSSI
jgi:hypothetical protein